MSRENSQLVEGLIPKGTACPFYKVCDICWHTCPTPRHLLEVNFSCGLARAFNLYSEKELVAMPVFNED